MEADGRVNVGKLLELVDEKTTFVSVMHVNNETGAINDINAVAKKVKEKNPRVVFHSDGVQGFGKIPFRLGKEVDLYSLSAHKIGGLKGTGALIRKKTLPIRPYLFGGGQENGWRSGTENVFGVKTLEYAAEKKFSSLAADYERLASYRESLWSALDPGIFARISPKDGTPYILTGFRPRTPRRNSSASRRRSRFDYRHRLRMFVQRKIPLFACRSRLRIQ